MRDYYRKNFRNGESNEDFINWCERMCEATGIKVICAWCKKTMKDGSTPASHGICPRCRKGLEAEYRELKSKKILPDMKGKTYSGGACI